MACVIGVDGILEGLGSWSAEPVREPYMGVAVDSRGDCGGKIFFALKGARFDGHDFVKEALGKGAVCAVVERGRGERLFVVKDTLFALGEVAKRWRKLVSPNVVGITGSCGKTTTKEMLAHILSRRYRVSKTLGNQNNLVGLPLNLANMPSDTQVFVAEMGTNAPGEIRRLSLIAMPEVAVITSIGESHLEGLKSVEGVFEEKMGILSPGVDTLVFPDVSPFAKRAREVCAQKGVRYVGVGCSHSHAYFRRTEGGVVFCIFGREVAFKPLFCGEHLIFDALVACTVAVLLGFSPEEAVESVKEFEPSPGRFRVLRFKNMVLIDDSYNANPTSTKAALDYLASFPGKKLFVFGDMLELGEDSRRLHREIGLYARKKGVDFIIACGNDAQSTLEAFVESGGEGIFLGNHKDIVDFLVAHYGEYQAVLVKGSRGMRMEKVVEGIKGALEADLLP